MAETSPRTRTRKPRKEESPFKATERERPLLDSEPVDENPKIPPYREGKIAKALTSTYVTMGLMVGSFDMTCGQAIVVNAENMAQSWEKLAKTNPAVRRVLENLLKTSAVTEVVVAHMPLIAAIMSHHGPPQLQEKLSLFAPAVEEPVPHTANGHAG